jgi:hypothetical protein
MIWEIVKEKTEPFTTKDIRKEFIEAFEKQDELTSNNPGARTGSIMAVLRKRGIVVAHKAGGGKYIFNPDWYQPEESKE